MSIEVRQDQKVLIIGDFQTGKTTLARHLVAGFPSWAAFDPTWALHDGVHDIRQLDSHFRQHGYGVYQPTDAEAEFEEFCWWALEQSNAAMFIDEPALVMSSRGSIPDGFSALYRLGHKRGVGVTLATHRFHGDLPALTRILHHLFVFRCTIDVDIDALRGFIGEDGAAWVRNAPDYHFWYKGLRHSGPMAPIDTTATA